MDFKPYLKKLTPYPPGKTVDEIKRELGIEGPVYKFNSNENPLGPSRKVVKVIKELAKTVNLYPEASYIELKRALAKKWGLSPENFILGNGSNEVIELVFKALINPGDEVLVSKPSFLMYEKFAQIYGAKVKVVPLDNKLKHDISGLLKNLSNKTKVVFLDHPNNPTGSVLDRKDWGIFFKNLPENILVVIDEAYGEFIEDPEIPLGIEFLKNGFNVLVLRTFSKAYGLAGLRLGYGMAEKSLAQLLDSLRQPFNLNLFAYKAGLIALEDQAYLKKSLKIVKEGRRYLTQELSSLGFKVYPSQANFIMVDFGSVCEHLYQGLLRRGLLLRPLKPYGFPNSLRITIGLPEQNQLLVKNIKELLG